MDAKNRLQMNTLFKRQDVASSPPHLNHAAHLRRQRRRLAYVRRGNGHVARRLHSLGRGRHECYQRCVAFCAPRAPTPALAPRPDRPVSCLYPAGAAKKQALEKANNVALKGNTVLFGRLVGVVFATGPRTVLGRTKDLFSSRGALPKLKRGIDKKKVRAMPDRGRSRR